jgi:predicted nucleotidyltransferase
MARSVSANYEGIPVKVIGIDDLVANKKATGRGKDALDVKEFEKRGLVRK